MKWKRIKESTENEVSPKMDFFRKYNDEIKNLIEDFLEKKGIKGATYEIKQWHGHEGTISSDIGEFPITVGTMHESDPRKPIGYWRSDIDTGKVTIYQSWLKPKPGSYASRGIKPPISFTDDEDAFNGFVDAIRRNLHNLERIVQDFKNRIERGNGIGESVNPDVPHTPLKFILHDVDEITPEHDSYGSLASDAQFLIDEYLGKQAKAYYRNGHIPEDEEEEWRECLAAVLVEFEYWMPEDEDRYAGYEDGRMLFIIDRCDGELCEVDDFTNDRPEEIPDEAREEAEKEAYKFLGIRKN